MAPICTSVTMSVKPARRATGELRMGERMRPQGQLWRDQNTTCSLRYLSSRLTKGYVGREMVSYVVPRKMVWYVVPRGNIKGLKGAGQGQGTVHLYPVQPCDDSFLNFIVTSNQPCTDIDRPGTRRPDRQRHRHKDREQRAERRGRREEDKALNQRWATLQETGGFFRSTISPASIEEGAAARSPRLARFHARRWRAPRGLKTARTVFFEFFFTHVPARVGLQCIAHITGQGPTGRQVSSGRDGRG